MGPVAPTGPGAPVGGGGSQVAVRECPGGLQGLWHQLDLGHLWEWSQVVLWGHVVVDLVALEWSCCIQNDGNDGQFSST